jgi:hypothetical protein
MAPHHQKSPVHGFVHCFVTEGVVCTFVLHVVCAIETVLVAPFLSVACGICVPIFNVKSTAVADILACKRFHDIEKMNSFPLLCWLNPSRYVCNHVTPYEWAGGHWDASISSVAPTVGTAALAASSAATPATPLLVLLLETL